MNAEPKHIFVGAPCKSESGHPPWYTRQLIEVFRNGIPGYKLDFGITSTGSQAICRNILVAQMLSNKTMVGVLFIDSDMKWTLAHVHQLLERNKPIITAVYARKEKVTRYCMKGLPGEVVDKDGLLKIKNCGAGSLYIAREVFEAIAAENWQLRFKCIPNEYVPTDSMYNFFAQGVYGATKKKPGEFLGEDEAFCYLARKCGYDIYADTTLMIPHSGLADYPL